MKVLLVNNFNHNLLVGGVENYLVELLKYNNSINSEIEFYWYGKASKETNWLQKFYNPTTTSELKKIIDTFKPDLIHCFGVGAPVTPHFMYYAQKKKIPVLQSFRDYYYVCPKNFMLKGNGEIVQNHTSYIECILHHQPKKNIIYDSFLALKHAYHKQILKKNVTHFLTPSIAVTTAIEKHLKLKGETLPNPSLLNLSNETMLAEDYILYVGRLDVEKGVATLLKALEKVSKKFTKEKLLIVGNGNEKKDLIAFKEKNNLTNVEFLGSKNREELSTLYAKAKFVVVPSEFLESYGNVILEAFAFGKTVVISDLLGLKNEVEHYETGIIFPFGNIEKLVDAIQILLENTSYKKQLEQNAKQYVATKTMKNHFEKLQSIYTQVIENNQS